MELHDPPPTESLRSSYYLTIPKYNPAEAPHRLTKGTSAAGLRARGQAIDEDLPRHLSPLGWEHIKLTGDYTWRPSDELKSNGYRPLRSVLEASGRMMCGSRTLSADDTNILKIW